MSSRKASAAASERLAWIATAYPARASANTMARPMRRAPPVTRAAGCDAGARGNDMPSNYPGDLAPQPQEAVACDVRWGACSIRAQVSTRQVYECLSLILPSNLSLGAA